VKHRLLAALALASVAAVVGLSQAQGAVGGATTEHIYAPFTAGTIAKGLRVTKTIRGSCWTGSEGTARSDAWRCMSGNYIYDPCFSSQTGGTGAFVVCAQSPFVRTLVKFVLTKPLPYKYGNKDGDPTRFGPWGMRLSTGATCVSIQGATGAIAGMRIGYECSNKGVLVGSPKRSTPTWRIFFAKRFDSASLSAVSVAQAWW
jgi:hypothetical protein